MRLGDERESRTSKIVAAYVSRVAAAWVSAG